MSNSIRRERRAFFAEWCSKKETTHLNMNNNILISEKRVEAWVACEEYEAYGLMGVGSRVQGQCLIHIGQDLNPTRQRGVSTDTSLTLRVRIG